jgi:hypothetical protein
MTDDLVKRLRAYEGKGFETTACYNGMRSEAADRIEELEAKLADAVGDFESILLIPSSEAAYAIVKAFAKYGIAKIKGEQP